MRGEGGKTFWMKMMKTQRRKEGLGVNALVTKTIKIKIEEIHRKKVQQNVFDCSEKDRRVGWKRM